MFSDHLPEKRPYFKHYFLFLTLSGATILVNITERCLLWAGS